MTKNFYIPWPFRDRKLYGSESELKELHLAAYSFWLSETFNLEKSRSDLDYGPIRELFENTDYSILARRIIPFWKFSNTYGSKKDFSELYYNHWYTLFLESYSENVDLGTAMFLTSNSYEPEFLMKCSNWLRWVFNELRLIEAKAQKGVERKPEVVKQEFKDFKHDFETLIFAQDFFTDDIIRGDISKVKYDSLKYYTDTIKSFFRLRGKSFYLEKHDIFISVEIDNILSYMILICRDIFRLNWTFGLSLEEHQFIEYKDLRFLEYDRKELVFNGDNGLFRLLLKDLISNLIKHSDSSSPLCKIKSEYRDNSISLMFLNSKWPDTITLNKMQNNSFEARKKGWKRIMNLVNIAKFKIEIPEDYKDRQYEDFFWIKLIIPKK